MKWKKEEWERLCPGGPGELNILDEALELFDEQELFGDWLTAISDEDQDLDLHAALHDHPYAAKEPQDQTAPTLIMDLLTEAQCWHSQNPWPLCAPPVPVQPVPLVQTLFPVKAPVSPKEEKVADGPYIKKPPNAFIRFLKQNRKSAVEELGVASSAVVNKHLGQRWKSLSPEEREKYVSEAKADSLIHSVTNSGWTNSNNYGKKRKQIRPKVVRTKEVIPASMGQ